MNNKKLMTKEDIINELKSYKRILTSPMIDYLNELINLNFSVLEKRLDEEDNKLLSEIDIYKKVAVYNIYNRTLNILKNIDGNFTISENNKVPRLEAFKEFNNKKIELFNYNYDDGLYEERKLYHKYKNSRIGQINLYKTEENKRVRELEIKKIENNINNIKSNGTIWNHFYKKELLKKYKKLLNEIQEKGNIYSIDKEEIELTNKVHDLLFEEYQLNLNEFEDETRKYLSKVEQPNCLMNKTLIKETPNLVIRDNIKYL